MAKTDSVFEPRTGSSDLGTLGEVATHEIALLDAVDLPIIVVGRDCTIARINRAATVALGVAVSDVGAPLRSSLAGVENLDQLCAQVMADGLACRREARDGDRYFLLRIAPYTGSDRQILGAVLTFTNFTGFRASIEQAIYEREYTKAILNTVINPLVVLDAKLQIQTANRAFYALFGVSRDESQDIPIGKLGNREWETSQVWGSIKTTLSDDTQFQAVEIEREFPAIGTRTVALNACRLARDGHALILLTFQDVTERKRTERALRESEERFRAIVETTPECVKLIAADGALLHMNLSGLRMVGAVSAEEVVGKSVYDLIAPKDRERFKAFNESICQGENGSLQFEILGLRGQRRHMETHAAPLRNPDGTVVQLAVTSDISERKQADELLRRSEERFRALVTASSDVVYRVSPDWSEMRRLDGRGFIADTAKPRKDWLNEYVHPDDQPVVLRTIREAMLTKSTFQLEHRVRRIDGQHGWTYSRAVPLLDVNAEIVEWFGAATDVTARKEAEEKYRTLAETLDAEVRARTRQLEEQSGQVRELSWRLLRSQDEEHRRIARELHDSVGQLLAALSMNIAAVQNHRLDPEIAQSLTENAAIVEQISREIRTISHLLHPPLLDVAGLISAVRWYVDGFSERSRIKVELDLPERFPRLSDDMEIAIFRLVQECLTNIHRHSGSDRAKVTVREENSGFVLEVKDWGRGIPPSKQAELNSGRMGVGFRGMRERLKQFAGQLEIHSNGEGTLVIATMRLVPEPAADKSESGYLEPTLEPKSAN